MSTPTPRPPRERATDSRESVLRASILESALELGVGSSCTVTKWMFSPVEEGNEDAEADVEVSIVRLRAFTACSVASAGHRVPESNLRINCDFG